MKNDVGSVPCATSFLLQCLTSAAPQFEELAKKHQGRIKVCMINIVGGGPGEAKFAETAVTRLSRALSPLCTPRRLLCTPKRAATCEHSDVV